MKKGEILVLAIVGVVCAGPAAGNQTSMKRVLSKTGKTNLVVPSSNFFFFSNISSPINVHFCFEFE